jgi:hypothetical protein
MSREGSMAGMFELRAPKDLRAKLRREYERLKSDPNDSDTAWNFLVTAEDMLDWLFPGDKEAMRRERDSDQLLQAVPDHHTPELETSSQARNGWPK